MIDERAIELLSRRATDYELKARREREHEADANSYIEFHYWIIATVLREVAIALDGGDAGEIERPAA